MNKKLGPLTALFVLITISASALCVRLSLADHIGDDSNLLRDHIVRNIINGEPVKVCSEYPNATQVAINLWHTALHDAGYIRESTKLFYIEKSDGYDDLTRVEKYQRLIDDCPKTTTTDHTPANHANMKMSSVLILSEVGLLGEDHRESCPDEAAACIRDMARQVSGPPYYTYLDRTLISVGSPAFPSAHANPNVDMRGSSRSSQKQFDQLSIVLAHELGHILGFDHTRAGERGIMDLLVGTGSVITDVDLRYYETSYKPAEVRIAIPRIELIESPGPGKIRVSFDAWHVHSEKAFEVRRGTGDGDDWSAPLLTVDETMLTQQGRYESPPNADISGQPVGTYVFGVFSTTSAYIKSDVYHSETLTITAGRVQCLSGGSVPAGQTCPKVDCISSPDVPDGQTCPKVDCISSPDVPDGQTCPKVDCISSPDVPDGQTCPKVDCISSPDVPDGQTCPKVDCISSPDVPDGQTCPKVDCISSPDVPDGQTCPKVDCISSPDVPDGQTCPKVDCISSPDVPDGQTCPKVDCISSPDVPDGQTCPKVDCISSPDVPDGQTCPKVDCISSPDVPDGQTCPKVDCPGGTTVPDGQTCPLVCSPACADCYTCNSGRCVFDCPSGQTCSAGACVKLCFDDQYNQVPCPPPHPCEIPYHPLCASSETPPPPPPPGEGPPDA